MSQQDLARAQCVSADAEIGYRRILVVAARSNKGPFTTELPTLALARQPFLGQALRVIAASP
jgi:hypothetical protein